MVPFAAWRSSNPVDASVHAYELGPGAENQCAGQVCSQKSSFLLGLVAVCSPQVPTCLVSPAAICGESLGALSRGDPDQL